MKPTPFDRLLERVRQLTEMRVEDLRKQASEDEPFLPGLDNRTRGECVSRLIDREFFDVLGARDAPKRRIRGHASRNGN